MILVEFALKNTEMVDALLSEIDDIASEKSSYEYGLPLYYESSKALLREAIYKWLLKVQQGVRDED